MISYNKNSAVYGVCTVVLGFVALMPLSASAASSNLIANPPLTATTTQGAGAASPNLIANPTFTATTTQGAGIVPTSWQHSAWGAALSATFSYPVAGEDDAFAAQVSIASYPASGLGNGAAEWYFNPVTVKGASLYTFSDWYTSDATSYLIAEWTLNNRTIEYDAIATLPPTNGTWQQTSQVFSAPANAVSLTTFHELQSIGTLTVDRYSLTAGSSQSGLSQALVSLTFDNGWESQYVNVLPLLEAARMNGTFYIITSLIDTSPYDFFTDPNEEISTTTSSKSVVWSPIYTDPTTQALLFSDTYNSKSSSVITASYATAGRTNSTVIGRLPAGTGKASFMFTLPTVSGGTVTPISIVHSSSGALSASNPSLTEYDESYMTPSELIALQAAGNELASHTVTHPDLTALTAAQAADELSQSRTALLTWGATLVDGFAYPFGNYSAAIESQVGAAGYTAARTVDIGYNTTATDKLTLKSNSIVETTPLSVVESWIDTAVANKLWLILVFHDVNPQTLLTQDNSTDGTTPQELQQIISYLQNKQQKGLLQVKTVHDALPLAH